MTRETTNALLACLVTFVLCAVVYPALVWGAAQVAFHDHAEGSLIRNADGKVLGSVLIAQPFASDRYFYPRPSAADYKADAAGGSNLGTKNPAQRKRVVERATALQATPEEPAPADMVMASGSGLDPHISPQSAYYQVERVAAARHLSVAEVRSIVEQSIDHSGAVLGAPSRVNVLMLNLRLDGKDRIPAR